jgi:hypothetical protein
MAIRHTRVLSSLAAIALLSIAAPAPAQFVPGQGTPVLPPATPTATMEDLRALYDKGAYRPCIQQISRLLGMGKNLPPGFDRSDIHYLRGECLLAQRDISSALRAYEDAAKEAGTPAQALGARAMVALVKASNSSGYRPTPSDQPIDIVARESRRKAMASLFSQRLPIVTRQVDGAMSARTLPQLTAQLPALLDLAAVEYGATGATAESMGPAGKLGDRARELIDIELSRVNSDLSAIQRRANTVVTDNAQQWHDTSGRTWWEGVERIGLTADERARLRNQSAYLEQILDACQKGRDLAHAYGGNVEAWKALTNTCERAVSQLEQIASRE